MNELFLTLADGTTRVFALEEKPLLLGRDPSCELAFPNDAELSRRHAIVERFGSEWCVRDLGSTNGTRLNGQPLTARQVLKPGDIIGASKLTMLFRDKSHHQSPRTVVFDTSKLEALSTGTVSLHLEDVLGSQEARPQGFTPGGGKQWVSPLQALLRVGRELATGRPLPELFPVVLDLALEGVNAERGVLMVLEGQELALKASRGGEFRISSAVRDRVIEARESVLIQSIADAPSLKERKSIVLQGVRSLMAVPLQTDERVIGLLYVDALNYLRKFTNDDLSLLTVMANVAAMRMERQRLAEVEERQRISDAEMAQAAEIQSRHLPQRPPAWPELELAARHLPSRSVGGDYYDYFRFADGRYGVVCGDVAGKGLPAALLMMSCQAHVHALAETAPSVSEFVRRLNRNVNRTCPPNRFITLFTCAIDGATGALTYTNAGHNPILLIRADGSIEKLTRGGLFVGLIPGLNFEEANVDFNHGDLLVLYSDGITEEDNAQDEEFGTERLAEICIERRHWKLDDLAVFIMDAVSKWTGGTPARDDQTIVLVRRTAN